MKWLKPAILAIALCAHPLCFASPYKIERWKTHNGVPVVYYPAMNVPMLDISIAFAAGSAYDGSRHGLSSLTEQLLNQGNAGLSATEIAESLADKGSQFSSETNRDMSVFSLRTLTEKEALNQSVKTFSQIINRPDFTNEAFEQEKNQLLMAIEQSQESPDEVAMIEFFLKLYKNHPYAHPVNGTKPTVQTLTQKEVSDFYQRYYVANNATLVLVGAVDLQTAHSIAETITQPLRAGSPAQPIPKAPSLVKEETISINFPSTQTMIRMGQIGIEHSNPDYFPLLVGNYILGGGTLLSRLGTEIREKHGLAYGITSQFVSMPGNGPFIISLSTKNNQATQALKLVKDTLEDYINKGPTQEELDAAKLYLTGSFPLSLTSNRDIASLLLRMTFYHLPDNYLETYLEQINKVSTESIQKAFALTVHPDKLLLVTVGQ